MNLNTPQITSLHGYHPASQSLEWSVLGMIGCMNSAQRCLCDLRRPAWVKDTEMHNPYKLKFPIHQYDYTFPSGHSAFVACLWLSYFFMSQQPGRAFHFHWWLHLVLAVLTVSTGYSRIYLSLHWPRGRDPSSYFFVCCSLQSVWRKERKNYAGVILNRKLWYTLASLESVLD